MSRLDHTGIRRAKGMQERILFCVYYLLALHFIVVTGRLTAMRSEATVFVKRVRRRVFQIGISCSVGAVIGGLSVVASAQSKGPAQAADPVASALTRIERTVAQRADAAQVVLEASRLLEEGRTAKTQGERERAIDTLDRAEKTVSAGRVDGRSYLADVLMNSIIQERSKFVPPPVVPDQGGVPTSAFEAALSPSVKARFEKYGGTLTRVLGEEEAPMEFLAVALVESGFNPQAMSPKGARGIWQFMPATAKRYGLAIESEIDPRTDPETSTRAAARYLLDLYEKFGDWKLALAAYNAGETRVQRIIDRTGVRDFDAMARRGYLPAETRNYVVAVLAAWSRLKGESGSALPDGKQAMFTTEDAAREP